MLSFRLNEGNPRVSGLSIQVSGAIAPLTPLRKPDDLYRAVVLEQMGSVGMQKEWLETVLKIGPLTPDSHEDDKEVLCELAKAPSTASQADMSTPQRLDGVVIGTLVGLNDVGEPLVDFPANCSGAPVVARSTVTVGQHEIGRETVLTFEGGNPEEPFIMGLIQPLQSEQPIAAESAHSDGQNPIVVEVDGKRLVFTAEKEIVLRCGKASITLTRAGKVLIRGAYLLSRSSGVNRIKGGSIQLN